jgi:hypothetical protein
MANGFEAFLTASKSFYGFFFPVRACAGGWRMQIPEQEQAMMSMRSIGTRQSFAAGQEEEGISVVTTGSVADCVSHSCVGRSCVGLNRMSVRFPYAFLFLLSLLIAWIVRDYGSVALSKLPRELIFSTSVIITSCHHRHHHSFRLHQAFIKTLLFSAIALFRFLQLPWKLFCSK